MDLRDIANHGERGGLKVPSKGKLFSEQDRQTEFSFWFLETGP
jgi:hypothetical protein